MSTNQASFPVAAMARVLGVSTAGYYAWRGRPPSAHAQADSELLTRVRTIHTSSRHLYGAPRVHAQLRADGGRHGRKRIARLMRAAGLVGACHRGSGPTTTRRNPDARPAPDLVDRKFTAKRPNQLWVADITFVPTAAGFLYLAVVLDACSRRTSDRRLVDGGPPAHGTCARRSGNGSGSEAVARCHSSFGPGKPIHVSCIWQSLPRGRRSALHGVGR